MATDAAAQPLLRDRRQIYQSSAFLFLGRWTLKILMWVIFLFWLSILFIMPIAFKRIIVFLVLTQGTIFGMSGSVFLLMSGPILILAFLAYIYMANFSQVHQSQKTQKPPRFKLWTFPALVQGPLGVVSAAELIWIVVVFVFVLWAASVYVIKAWNLTKDFTPTEAHPSPLSFALEFIGQGIGFVGMFCTCFLFLPVARGSILLRLVDIPFEHATRYHVWLGHLTMILFSLHGFSFILSWSLQGQLLTKISQWDSLGVAHLAGAIALSAGLLIWITSFRQVRERYFELFFYTHQLYVIFIVFFAMHVGDTIFTFVAGGLFLFVLDRFLRFCQSRTTVGVISASCLPCGAVELVLNKPPGLKYKALSFIFLQVKELSLLQWHPFSVSSSPLDGDSHITVLIKVLGGWTERLRTIITSPQYESSREVLSSAQPSTLTVSVEGPYGRQVAYHLMYENLVLVAGGIGISPFLAILSDVLHRAEEMRPCLPKNMHIIWVVKKSKELSLLSVVDLQKTCPSYSSKLNLKIQAYVTQESKPSLEEGDVFIEGRKMVHSSILDLPKAGRISNLVGSGNNFWAGAYYVVSIIGLVICYGLVQKFYVIHFGVISWWYKSLLLLACMVGSVVSFGGLLIFLWSHLERENADQGNNSEFRETNSPAAASESGKPDVMSLMNVEYGRRPDFQDTFDDLSRTIGHEDVGVLVCGPSELQSSVARECRRRMIHRKKDGPVFHFHCHSFDL